MSIKILHSELANPSPSHIVDLIHEFVKRYPKLQTPGGAVGRCKLASYELALYLKQRALNPRIVHLQSCTKDLYPDPHKTWADKPSTSWSHYVLAMGKWSIDMTARQFDAKLGVPHIERLSVLRQNWAVVEEDVMMNRWVMDTVKVRTR